MNKTTKHTLSVFLGIACWFITVRTYAQNIGINGTGAAPQTSAMLDISRSDGGLLIPRVALSGTGDVAAIPSSTLSLMIYNTATAGSAPNNVLPGFYYWNGTKWIAFGGTGGRDWSLLGNAGTVAGTHFLGTTDNVALNFKINNEVAGSVDPAGPTFFGHMAGSTNTASLNTGLGASALLSNTIGNGNVATGRTTFQSNTTGNNNVVAGESALTISNGSNNVAMGLNALIRSISGNDNVGIGQHKLLSFPSLDFMTGINNVLVGNYADDRITSGSYNVKLGQGSFFTLHNTGSYNIGIGVNSNINIATGSYNVSIGSSASTGTSNGLYNTTIGTFGGGGDGSNNTLTGHLVARNGTGAALNKSNNSLFGYQAGLVLRTGSNSVFVGSQAGNAVTTGSNNIVIGCNITVPSNTANNQLTIGNLIFGTGVVGAGTTVSTGSVGIGKSAPAYKLDVVGDISSSTNVRAAGVILTSDARLKKNILNLNAGAETIMKLRPVSYQKKESLEATEYTKNEIGFIAQEVQKVLPQLVHEGKDTNKILALDYNSLIPIITKAMQEQQVQIKQLTDTHANNNSLLKTDHDVAKSQNDLLKADIDRLKKQNEEILNTLYKNKK